MLSYCSAAQCCQIRAVDQEASHILCSRVEKRIRNACHSSEVLQFLKGTKDSLGDIILNGGRIKFNPCVPYCYGLSGTNIAAPPVAPQLPCQARVLEHTYNGTQILNGSDMLNAFYFMLRLAHIEDYTERRFWDDDAFFICSRKDIEVATQIAKQVDVTGSWRHEAKDDNGDGIWKKVAAYCPPADGPNFHYQAVRNKTGVISYLLKIEFLDAYGTYRILPVSFFQNQYYDSLLELYVPPKPPYTLLGIDLLRHSSSREIVLTDDYRYYIDSGKTALFNPGGDAWIDALDVAPLSNFDKIVTIAFDENNYYSHSSAIQMASKLQTFNIEPRFVNYG